MTDLPIIDISGGGYKEVAFLLSLQVFRNDFMIKGLPLKSDEEEAEIIELLYNLGLKILLFTQEHSGHEESDFSSTTNEESDFSPPTDEKGDLSSPTNAENSLIRIGSPINVKVLRSENFISEKLTPYIIAICLKSKGISTFKSKISDRAVKEFSKIGARIEKKEDYIIVDGTSIISGGEASSFGDPNLAAALYFCNFISENMIKVNGLEAIEKIYKGFRDVIFFDEKSFEKDLR